MVQMIVSETEIQTWCISNTTPDIYYRSKGGKKQSMISAKHYGDQC